MDKKINSLSFSKRKLGVQIFSSIRKDVSRHKITLKSSLERCSKTEDITDN
ncbi:11107_t:CDS:2 [Gigaspora margarita]|uniref:11107_t:CDS:1 n=1 Tax=Gigaspora margarita TaxID=4874 RepID=A0ABN7URD5_GIGMA|nr:11107_t:CDS:2 [Gigaspora margarita]